MEQGSAKQESYAGASKQAIGQHYDLSNDFYRLWLDDSMTYSCALWDPALPGDTLEAAQTRKLDYMAERAQLGAGSKVLDIGCGWGSMMRRLVEVHGAKKVIGLTLSEAQAAWIRDLEVTGLEVRTENWTEHLPSRDPYDAIISIGAFEHFSRMGLSRPESTSSYRAFFERCDELLVSGGRLALQTIVKGNTRPKVGDVRDAKLLTRIFRESQLPWIGQIFEASELLFEPLSCRIDGDHYARTTAEWLRRLEARRTEAAAFVGAEEADLYERYLEACVRLFERGQMNLVRLTFTKTG